MAHKKILLIEDNPDMRENTSEILELADYEVITASHGKEGVEKAKKELPDLIICDIMMPELDGYGVLFMLSKGTDTAKIPFIFLTAKSEKSDFRKGMELGADDYLTKPFEEMDLLNAIESRLKKSDLIKQQAAITTDYIPDFIDKVSGLKELHNLSQDRKIKRFIKKSEIYREDDTANYLYLIHSGRIKTSKINEDGKEYVTGLHASGDFLGYADLLHDGEYRETATALEPSEVYLIPKHDFLSLVYNNREVAHRFIQLLSQNVSTKEQQLVDLAYDTVRKRVADALLSLKEKYGKEDEATFSITIARDDLASMAGTATESVIRMLSEFKHDKLINIQGSKITLLNADKLSKMMF